MIILSRFYCGAEIRLHSKFYYKQRCTFPGSPPAGERPSKESVGLLDWQRISCQLRRWQDDHYQSLLPWTQKQVVLCGLEPQRAELDAQSTCQGLGELGPESGGNCTRHREGLFSDSWLPYVISGAPSDVIVSYLPPSPFEGERQCRIKMFHGN